MRSDLSTGRASDAPHYVSDFADEAVVQIDSVKLDERRSNLWIDAWRDLRRRPVFWVSGVLILFITVVALFPGLFTSVDPRFCDIAKSNAGPEAGHVLGYTRQGCDVYARIVTGTGTSLSVGLIVVLLTSVLGILFGSLAGYYGGVVDAVLSRAGDIFFSIPYILAAVVIMSVLSAHRNIFVISLAIGLFAWPSTARVMRAEVMRVKNADFVMASIALGLSRFRILLRHVLPNAIAPVIVISTISLAAAITAEATLSFLGVGLPNSIMSWGNDISQAQATLRTEPMPLIWPSLALIVTVLSFILMGEALRNALDPRARARR
ncbi:ABC transporter permease [Desertivibrio insolitus]|uniref:ABC transporter permease n=1 Tax=Herbiconiux sp. SYSU D00978 TaxID=2812562 RepID=UPI001A96CC5B|nr:ABC transporter permease [Herbiconiux sp. SYSU D00978]